MGNKWDKFMLLMWKNWTLLRRRPIHTAFEIICPVLLCLILVGIRALVHIREVPEISYEAFSISDSTDEIPNKGYVAYSPSNPLLNETLKNILHNYNNEVITIVDFENADELNSEIDNNLNFTKHLAYALVFSDSMKHVTSLKDFPSNVDVTIRLNTTNDEDIRMPWYTNLLYPDFQTPGPRSSYSNNGGPPNYFSRGFLDLQYQITLGLINYTKSVSNFTVLMKRFPYPSWLEDPLYADALESTMSLIIMLSFMYNYVNTIKAIAIEKEKQLKESMKVMGLPGWLHWVSWFTRSFIILFIAIILLDIALLAKITERAVFAHSDWSVMFLFLILYACSSITFTFLISVFFSKANTAAAVGSIIFFVGYLPYALQRQNSDLPLVSALGSCLLSNSALSFGISIILRYEALETGIQWSNLCNTVSPDDHLTLGAIYLMLIFDTFLYLGLALYIEAIFPGEFGVPQPWYYPFTRSYWCKVLPAVDTNISVNQGLCFEDFTEPIPVGIQLQNLSKKFGSNIAVNRINLNMYEGHITVLLGHNGAGKTTTMSMITGMFLPTSGTAIVNGYDVRTNAESVRDSMGICLQHNVLFDNLTVWEHLYFFGKLKGLRNDEINQEIDSYISLMELEDKRNARSSTLSGGMKRKLSIGMALCGKSKVVILDEPTAGMDPSARRSVWNLLQKQKQKRTILLTTHFMDEADLLGDRIAIMTGGELQCCGSSFFLKRKYGAGYYLTMDVSSECQPNEVTNLLRKYIPYLKIHSHVGSEVTYQLPENESAKFESIFQELENNLNSLGVRSYGVSLTTLEEVFMKVGADHDNEISKNYNKQNSLNGSRESVVTIDSSENRFMTHHLSGFPLIKNQVIAMFSKKVLSIIRTWYLLTLQIVLPVVLLILTVLGARNNVPETTFTSLEMTLDKYNDPITLLENNAGSEDFTNIYENTLSKHRFKIVSNISEEILEQTKQSPSYVKMHYIIGASFDSTAATGWFNGDPYHSTALSLGYLLNTLYKREIGKEKSIHFFNHPLPVSLDVQREELQFYLMGLQIACQMGYGMAFVASFYILFYIRERVCKVKHLQFVSGVNVFVFWGTAFLCDLITYILTMSVILITFASLQQDGFSSVDELGRVTVALLSFGFFVLPFVYLASYLFSIPSTGFSRVMLLGTVVSIIGIVTIQVLELMNRKDVSEPLHWVLLFIPFYSLAKGVYDLSIIYNLRKICSNYGSTYDPTFNNTSCNINDYFSLGTPGIGRNVIISFLMSFLLMALLILNEFGFISFIINRVFNSNSKPPVGNTQLEEDVQEEKDKIKTTDLNVLNSNYCLVLNDVTKYYKKFVAVNGLFLSVKPFECFGLLGINGAGKTTTFKMMTGDEHISYGDIWVKGLNIKTQQKEAQKFIGYCPQFDALLDDLTARETLKIFALIRGVPLEKCKSLGERLAHEFDFFKHLDKKVKELSGGNKRKLSTTLALIGDPPVIYLDEPTTGMDPATKRFIWTALAKLRNSGKCIILTSHSMEECEALCTRIAIMVNGNFKCLGSTQRLKNKFAQGYSLTLKIKKLDNINFDDEITVIDNFIQRNFPGAQLKEKYQELISYQLVDNSLPWSKMFGILERSKTELHIEDYSLGQCSLEQVFLSFTKHQQ